MTYINLICCKLIENAPYSELGILSSISSCTNLGALSLSDTCMLNIQDPFFGISRYDAVKQTESSGPTRIMFVSGSDSSKKRGRTVSTDNDDAIGLDSIGGLSNALPSINGFGSDPLNMCSLNAALSSSVARERFVEANKLLEAFMNPGLSDPGSASSSSASGPVGGLGSGTIKRSRTESSEDEQADIVVDQSSYFAEYCEQGQMWEGEEEDGMDGNCF